MTLTQVNHEPPDLFRFREARAYAAGTTAYPTSNTGHVNKRAAGLAWVIAALGLGVALVYITFVGSLLNSCGAGDHGPNPGSEADFCGFGGGEPTDYSALFVFVQIIPAIPVLGGGLLLSLGRSRLYFAAGVGIGVLLTALIWALEP